MGETETPYLAWRPGVDGNLREPGPDRAVALSLQSPNWRTPSCGSSWRCSRWRRCSVRRRSQIGLLYACAAIVVVTVLCRLRYYRLWELGLLAGLALLANVAFRGAMDWLLVMLALGVPHVKELLAEAAVFRRRSGRRRPGCCVWIARPNKCWAAAWFRWQPVWPAAALLVLFVISVIPPLARAMPRQNAADWPVAALDHIRKAGLKGRFFAPPDYGAYVGWRLGEAGKVYTDTRGFFFPPILIEDSHFIPQLGPAWRDRLKRVLDEYHTDFFLLETTGPRGALWRTLQEHGSTPLYLDQQTVLLTADQVRRGTNASDAGKLAAAR